MSEELSSESKLYIRDTVEELRKEFKADLESVKSKTTRVFSAIVLVVGLAASLGVYGLATQYIKKAISEGLSDDAVFKLKEKAKDSHDMIVQWAAEAETLVSKLRNKRLTVTFGEGREIPEQHQPGRRGVPSPKMDFREGYTLSGYYQDGGVTIFYFRPLKVEFADAPPG